MRVVDALELAAPLLLSALSQAERALSRVRLAKITELARRMQQRWADNTARGISAGQWYPYLQRRRRQLHPKADEQSANPAAHTGRQTTAAPKCCRHAYTKKNQGGQVSEAGDLANQC